MSLRTLFLSLGVCLGAQAASAAAFTDTFDYHGAPQWPWEVKNNTATVQDGKLFLSSSGSPRDALVTAFDGNAELINYRVDVDVDPLEDRGSWPEATVAVRADNYFRGGSSTPMGRAYEVSLVRQNELGGPLQYGPLNSISIQRHDEPAGSRVLNSALIPDLPLEPFNLSVTVRDVLNSVISSRSGSSPVTGALIDVTINNVPTLIALDPDPLPGGGIGLFTLWEAQTTFDNVVLTTYDSTVVPLPTALPLLASGLVVVGLVRRRARSA